MDVALPNAAFLGQPNRLPRTGTLHLEDGSTSTRRTSWEAQLDRPGLVEVTGTLSGNEGLTVTRRVLVAPRHMVHAVNAGGAETSDYLALREHARGPKLRNSVADQPYGPDPRTGAVWGYQGRSKPAGSETDSMDRSLRYATDHDDLVYRFANLARGSYTVHVSYYDPWPWADRAAEVSVNGAVVEAEQLFTGTPEAAAYEGIAVGEDGEIVLSLHPTRSPDIQVSWIVLVKE